MNQKTQSLNDSKKSTDTIDLDLEKEMHSMWLESKSFRIALISTFSALCIVIGYLLATIPNIELFTLTIFLSGFTLGKRDGMIIGIFSSFIFCFFNPFGLLGALITLNFQIFSYLIDVLSFFGTLEEFLPYFLTGIIFTTVHIIGNTLGFIFILPGLIQLVNKMLHK